MDKLLLVNKERHYSSRDVVNVLSRHFDYGKIGHFGTLDPIAEGLLLVGFGGFTRLGNFLLDDRKEYIAEVLVGTSTDTYDLTGRVIIEEQILDIDEKELRKVINSYKKKYLQTAPGYSAIKVKGKRLYKYSREGKAVELPKREVEIFDIKFIDLYKKDNKLYFKFIVNVSKGTYIRSLVNDISNDMNIPMAMSSLIRTKQDKFRVEDSYTLEQIKNNNFKFVDIKDVLDLDIKEIPEEDKIKILSGSLIKKKTKKDYVLFTKNKEEYVLYQTYSKDLTKMHPILFFNK